MDERPDDILVEEARRGKREAFSELARRHQQRIYGLIYGMTRNRSDADDLCQEVFLTAFRSIPGFHGRSSFSTWVYRIAVNASLNFLKKRDRERARAGFHENLPERDGRKAAASSPEMSAVSNELQDRIEDAVGSLPPHFKASFLLVAGQGLSHAEAARALGCSENTVSWRMHKARKMLQARLKPFLDEVGS
jgi:RNA polymerase sigma-70 factor (ECF subfamily)